MAMGDDDDDDDDDDDGDDDDGDDGDVYHSCTPRYKGVNMFPHCGSLWLSFTYDGLEESPNLCW